MGLLPFQPEDHRLYFGRDEAVASVIGNMSRERFVALVGPSGSGKSSLLRAGVVAELQRGDGDAPPWITVLLTPGGRPLVELAAAVSALTGASPASLLRDLEADP